MICRGTCYFLVSPHLCQTWQMKFEILKNQKLFSSLEYLDGKGMSGYKKGEKEKKEKFLRHWTIQSATTFLERCRKVVWEILFEKSCSRKMAIQIWIFLVWQKWFNKSGWPEKRWVYNINPPFFRLEKSGFAHSEFFSGLRKMVDQKKNPGLQNHSRTTFLYLYRKVVAD